MSINRFRKELAVAAYSKNDKRWFVSWVRRYASFLDLGNQDELSISPAQTIEFSRTLLQHGTAAWQRLQAVREGDFGARQVTCSRSLPISGF